MLELLLLFILVCGAGAAALVVAGATLVYFTGLLAFKIVLMPFKMVWLMGKGAVLLAFFIGLLLVKLLWSLVLVAVTVALACGIVWLIARMLTRRISDVDTQYRARQSTPPFTRVQGRIQHFENRMLRLEQVLNRASRLKEGL